jgi:hypothetical protein
MLPGYTGLVSTGPVPTFLSLLVLLLTRRFEVEDFASIAKIGDIVVGSLFMNAAKRGYYGAHEAQPAG